MKTVVLLTISNLFMTLAWYGHLRYLRGGHWPMLAVIFISWGIAFFEYCFQVPANRIGYASYSATQLKIIQEVISGRVLPLRHRRPRRETALEPRRFFPLPARRRLFRLPESQARRRLR
ncbi:MAG TPA: DMT family protein [Kiritimatiellia bacterium]|nr:DMT family protein [Kiritimatiellia bacterium]